eukprot:TRINITY_DN13926_c0_g2_i1.p1 TRINITY_DN13926_c0_g2~~TRINITY_DN13926_c0_g2_i1.p1  ORF type:complete len:386 (-),score=72.07 TRINITY_DN13926_c0_g2_i1:169-1326(-)
MIVLLILNILVPLLAIPSQKFNKYLLRRMKKREKTCSKQGQNTNSVESTVSPMKFAFSKEVKQMKNYINDLEHSCSINKAILAELVTAHVGNEQTRNIINGLNIENANLQLQLKNAIAERNRLQSKLLISEQITADLRKHERESAKDADWLKRELVDQLDRKEFLLQSLEHRYELAVQTLREFAHIHPKIKQLVRDLAVDKRTEGKVTNTIEKNERLQTELIREKERVHELISHLTVNTTTGSPRTQSKSSLKDRRCHFSSPSDPLSKKLASSGGEEMSRDEMRERMLELYKVNTRLSEALKQANEKIVKLYTQRTNRKKIEKLAVNNEHRCKTSNYLYKRVVKKSVEKNERMRESHKSNAKRVLDDEIDSFGTCNTKQTVKSLN